VSAMSSRHIRVLLISLCQGLGGLNSLPVMTFTRKIINYARHARTFPRSIDEKSQFYYVNAMFSKAYLSHELVEGLQACGVLPGFNGSPRLPVIEDNIPEDRTLLQSSLKQAFDAIYFIYFSSTVKNNACTFAVYS